MSLIKLENVEKKYKIGEQEVLALSNINLEINNGNFLAIMGPSGSGKSTLMNLIGLLDRPSSGKYFLKGQDVNEKSDKEWAKIRNQEVGFVFQTFNLLPKISSLENVLLPLMYNKDPETKKETGLAKEYMEKVGLAERMKHKPNELSGGEKQRVAIARALICQPTIILADEPTGNLDSKSGHGVMEILKKLNSEGKTIILVTHDENIAKYAHRIIKLYDGRII